MKRVLLLTGGWAMLALGGVGVLVPVLPTTPFVLLAAGCFSCASPRVYALLLRSRFFGPYIENYRTGGGVPWSAKIRGLVMLWPLLILSMVSIQKPVMTAVLLVVGAAVTAHLLLLKTRRNTALAEEDAREEDVA